MTGRSPRKAPAQVPSLRRLYDELNEQFFGGRLPRFRVSWYSPAPGERGECVPARRLIRLQRGLEGVELRRTLLHEMCHIGGPGHGRRFQEKLAVLALLGEDWAEAEAVAYREGGPLAGSLTRQIRRALEQIVIDLPRARWTKVVRMVCRAHHLTPAMFHRAAPWAEKTWRAIVADHRARAARRPSRGTGC